jgi:hypothetical protein
MFQPPDPQPARAELLPRRHGAFGARAHRWRTGASVVVACVLLSVASACGTTSATQNTAPRKTIATAPRVVTVPLASAAAPAARRARPDQKTRIATAPRRPAALPQPDRLIGMDGAAVAALLGPARFVRRDGVAEVWQYRNEHCVLDVFLYGRDHLNVAHFDLRKRRNGAMAAKTCYANLAKDANADS